MSVFWCESDEGGRIARFLVEPRSGRDEEYLRGHAKPVPHLLAGSFLLMNSMTFSMKTWKCALSEMFVNDPKISLSQDKGRKSEREWNMEKGVMITCFVRLIPTKRLQKQKASHEFPITELDFVLILSFFGGDIELTN